MNPLTSRVIFCFSGLLPDTSHLLWLISCKLALIALPTLFGYQFFRIFLPNFHHGHVEIPTVSTHLDSFRVPYHWEPQWNPDLQWHTDPFGCSDNIGLLDLLPQEQCVDCDCHRNGHSPHTVSPIPSCVPSGPLRSSQKDTTIGILHSRNVWDLLPLGKNVCPHLFLHAFLPLFLL